LKVPFRQRVEMAKECLGGISPDLLYVNSAGSAEWCVAGQELGLPVVFHAHEMREGLLGLAGADIFKLDIARYVDLLVAASDTVIRDLKRLVRIDFKTICDFGIALDVKRILALRTAELPPPVDVKGAALSRSRPVVAMCGAASRRKGSDLFVELAKKLPGIQFLWIGAWFPKEASDNPGYRDFAKGKVRNLYVTGSTENPYGYLDLCDLFILTSREDPNPLVVAEAIVLGKKVVGFADTGGSKSFLERYGYGLSGSVDVERLLKLLPRLLAAPATPQWLARRLEDFRHSIDMNTKMVDLECRLLAIAATGRLARTPLSLDQPQCYIAPVGA
jgi:L-malate glycosyltransferase